MHLFLFHNLVYFFSCPASLGYWSYYYCSSLFIRSILALRLFNSFCFKYATSNNYVISSSLKLGHNFNLKKRSSINKRGISFFNIDSTSTEFSSTRGSGKASNRWLTPLEIVNRANKVEKDRISNFTYSNKLKHLPSFLYSFFFRRKFFFSLFKDKIYKLSRKFFIFFSSFSLMYKRIFDTFGVHTRYTFPLFAYKLYHSNLLSQLFSGSFSYNKKNINNNKYFSFHKFGNSYIVGKAYKSYTYKHKRYLKFRVQSVNYMPTRKILVRRFNFLRCTITRPKSKRIKKFFRFISLIPAYNTFYSCINQAYRAGNIAFFSSHNRRTRAPI